MRHLLIIAFIALLQIGPSKSMGQNRYSLHMKSESLQDGLVNTSEADLFYSFPDGKLFMHNTLPEEFIYETNLYGEAKVYYPSRNQFVSKANILFNSQNNNLYYFLSNQTYDLGLGQLGFKIETSYEEDGLYISEWKAPQKLEKQVFRIKLVHKDMSPIHSLYQDAKGKAIVKVYFEDYISHAGNQIPSRITEIVFLPKKDSIIKRYTYSNFNTGRDLHPEIFEFKIPKDATEIK